MSANQIGRDWFSQGACATSDVNFFPGRGNNKGVQAAKAVCAGCPVVEQCLAYAMSGGEKYGVWGGKSENQRRALRPAREIVHGRNSTYQHRCCRCDLCRKASARYRAEMRLKGAMA